jgi:hypothetical protein
LPRGRSLFKRLVPVVLLAFLLIGLLTLMLFNIQPAKARIGTVYIRADGSVDPSTALFLDMKIYMF